MEIKDILSEREIAKYHEAWRNFSGKYTLEEEFNVHSSMPVISKVFQFRDKPIFRTHVIQKELKKFNPYFTSNKYPHPFWHAQHFFMVLEQFYHESSNKIRDNPKLIGKENEAHIYLKRPVMWRDRVSVELILEDLGKFHGYDREKDYSFFYNESNNKIYAEISVQTFWQLRAYIQEIEKIKQGNREAVDSLIRKIEMQDINLKRLIKPRKTLMNSDELISRLKEGNLPEQELHDFFSFWDKKS